MAAGRQAAAQAAARRFDPRLPGHVTSPASHPPCRPQPPSGRSLTAPSARKRLRARVRWVKAVDDGADGRPPSVIPRRSSPVDHSPSVIPHRSSPVGADGRPPSAHEAG